MLIWSIWFDVALFGNSDIKVNSKGLKAKWENTHKTVVYTLWDTIFVDLTALIRQVKLGIVTLGRVGGLLNESHPRVFQTITLSFFIAFKAKQG